MRRLPVLSLVSLVLLAPLGGADVLVVGPSSLGGTHSTIQSAVDAASEGDVIVVAVDSPGFTVDGKGLSVVRWPDLDVEVTGTIRVTGLPAGSAVLLDELSVTGGSAFPQSDPALALSANQGQVRVQSCTLIGGLGTGWSGCVYGSGGDAVVIDTSMGVVLKDCTLRGGQAGVGGVACEGTRGGHGLQISASVVGVYGGQITGGHGGQSAGTPGDGGDGIHVLSWGVFASGTDIEGGHCGYNGSGFGNGDGGDGVYVEAATQARLLDVTTAGGSIFGTTGNGSYGAPTAGPGSVTWLPGNHQSLEVEPLAAHGERYTLDLSADPGSEAWVFVSQSTVMRYLPAWSGFLTAPANTPVTQAPSAVVPWSGHLVVELPSPLPAGEAGTFWLQVLVKPPGGAPILSSPEAVVVLRPDALPPDCNLNGAADLHDLVAGTSQDCDASGVPDECEPAPSTLYVDPAAAPGGDGSAGAPFQTLKQAFAAASSCDTILLADGIYSGPDNRKLVLFGASALTLRSANGPAACVIDLQKLGDLWRFGGTYVRLEGLTVLNGSTTAFEVIGGSDTVEIVDCVFENCAGSALELTGLSVRVEGCRFTGNSGFSGGAIFCRGIRDLAVIDSVFEGNTSTNGGAIGGQNNQTTTNGYPTSPHGDAVFARCSFLGNSASLFGGAVYNYNTYARVESCVFAGNSATYGGAIASTSQFEIDQCTFVGNSASSQGGAIQSDAYFADDLQALLANSILWGNAAPMGPEIHLDGGPVTLDVRHSDVLGGQAGVSVVSGSTLVWGTGNLDLDPLFADPDGPDNDPQTLDDNDWRLSAGSPCIDAGSNPLLPQDLADQDEDGKRSEPTPFDLDGGERTQDDPTAPDTGVGPAPIVDMGAYERP